MIASMEDTVLRVARKTLAEKGLHLDLTLESTLAEDGLGVDSIDRLDVLAAIESETGIDIPEEYWGGRAFSNLGEVACVLRELAGNRAK